MKWIAYVHRESFQTVEKEGYRIKQLNIFIRPHLGIVKNLSPDVGLEPTTLRLKVSCSTD